MLVLMVGIICGSIAGAFFALTHDLPQIRSLEISSPMPLPVSTRSIKLS